MRQPAVSQALVWLALGWLWWGLSGCCATVPASQRPAPPRVAIAVEFDPALPVVGELTVRHESGFVAQVSAPPSGVDLRVPPGPLLLRLCVAGEAHEMVLRVVDGGVVRWAWQPH